MGPSDHIILARDIASLARGKPTQVALRRAVSTAYYAMFHALAQCGADLLIGGQGSNRSMEAWRQVYRALDHGFAKRMCSKGNVIKKFPQAVQDFANMFVTMQGKRHDADYDPQARFSKSGVRTDIDAAEQAIKRFERAPKKDRRAFVALVLFKDRSLVVD